MFYTQVQQIPPGDANEWRDVTIAIRAYTDDVTLMFRYDAGASPSETLSAQNFKMFVCARQGINV